MENKSKIFLVVGPTGSGKTKLSVKIAKKYNAHIINADKEQMYKYLNIGTAKTTKEEMEGIPHYLIDFLELDREYTIKDYQTDARNILDKLISEKKNVVIVGGSGLYIKALLFNYEFEKEEDIKRDYKEYSNQELKDKVNLIDKDNEIHVNNRKRLERFLTHYYNTGKIINNSYKKNEALYDFNFIGISIPREELYDRINKRVDIMIKEGLVNEVSKYRKYSKLNDIIGYKEILMYLNKLITLDDAIELIKKNTRHYAKRQNTWFKTQFPNTNYYKIDYNDYDNSVQNILDSLDKK